MTAGVEVIEPRLVPLGGPRAMTVRRTLPTRARTLIGAWCFLDHYGPDEVSATGGMVVPPHPHTGLQTVSWLFTGEIEHRDSAGHHALVRPGELNLMTAGRGISHSEVSTPGTSVLHGAQLWVALPDAARFVEPGFEHYVPPTVPGDGVTSRVFLGALLGARSPVSTHTDLVGAELTVQPGAGVDLVVDPLHEHGILVDLGSVAVDGTATSPGELAYRPPGGATLTLRAGGDEPARVLLLGGPPLREQLVMWWNFVGRSHEEIEAFRTRWESELAGAAPSASEEATTAPTPVAAAFGLPDGDPLRPLPAPPLPGVRLRPRG